MLSRENYTKAHIEKMRTLTGADPSILERTIFAFGLLEAIKSVGLSFVFKGGTSLLLLLNEPRRLSTDIDIIVAPGTDIDAAIAQAGTIFPFLSVEEDVRQGLNYIVKRHFRFKFLSPRTEKEICVLLDVVFERCPYQYTTQSPIRSYFLLCDGEPLFVTTPDKNCILGDKLTAFAPHTTGIHLGIGKDMEVIKQMFDCWTLCREIDNYHAVAETFQRVAKIELGYRGLTITSQAVLLDTIESCICIMGRNGIRPEDYQSFATGINSLQGHIFNGRLNGENAGMMTCEIMYLATCLLTGQEEYDRIINPEPYHGEILTIKGAKRIRYIQNVDPLAYAYLVKSFQMLQAAGYFTESIL